MKVKIHNDSNFKQGRCSNGGCYGFYEIYEQAPFLENGEPAFFVYYSTTAEFDYCKFCGRFGDCICCDGPETITLTQLQQKIAEVEKKDHPDVYVEIIDPEIREVDWTKVRRRIEDALRKTAQPEQLFMMASLLSVKVW